MFKTPTPEAIAQRELLAAQRELLQAQSAMEEWMSVVSYNQARITRLKQYLTNKESK